MADTAIIHHEVGLPLTPVSDATIGAYTMLSVTRDL
jgi:hypothetical protein